MRRIALVMFAEHICCIPDAGILSLTARTWQFTRSFAVVAELFVAHFEGAFQFYSKHDELFGVFYVRRFFGNLLPLTWRLAVASHVNPWGEECHAHDRRL